jgi:poly(3-hydroxybutyrate) depolymerase
VLYSTHEFQQAATVSVRTAMQSVKTMFQHYVLPNGTFTWRGRALGPSAITDLGLLTVKAELHEISDAGQTSAESDLSRNLPDALKRNHQEVSGHRSTFSGQCWRNEILPQVHEAVLATA